MHVWNVYICIVLWKLNPCGENGFFISFVFCESVMFPLGLSRDNLTIITQPNYIGQSTSTMLARIVKARHNNLSGYAWDLNTSKKDLTICEYSSCMLNSYGLWIWLIKVQCNNQNTKFKTLHLSTRCLLQTNNSTLVKFL